MGRGEKLLDRMRASPLDWAIGDVVAVCEAHGIACDPPRGGSHYKVKHRDMPAILTIPAHRPIKPFYVRELVAFIDAVRKA
jgi:predicted RNA binding protein YcfA (HicA-like mRNA interferase family)